MDSCLRGVPVFCEPKTILRFALGVIQVLCNVDGGGGVYIFRKKHYEGVIFNVISVTRRWVGVQFPEKSIT